MRDSLGKWALLFGCVFAARMAHLRILWVEECYPAAAAIQILHGQVPYRDFFYDKPPLSPLLYLLWNAQPGWPLRLAGALFVVLCSWLIYRLALRMWNPREAWIAAALLAFFLTFYIPSAVMALAPDLLMLAPHLGAVLLAYRGMPVGAGLTAGVATLLHAKGLIVVAVAILVRPRQARRVLAGFALMALAALGGLSWSGALGAFWRQVWQWGGLYASDTYLSSPLTSGLQRTASWAGFHATLVVGALVFWRKERTSNRWMLGWALLSLAGVAAGWRFFPRYYFQLLPVFTLGAARGLCLLQPRHALLVLTLLLVPLGRFGPRYATLGADLLAGREHTWSDVAMNTDSRRASEILRELAQPGDTLLVWGYRPDLFVYTRLPAGAPFLDSQPLTGVLADRHLTDSRPTAPGWAQVNREALGRSRPTFVADGLGRYNRSLAITSFADLRPWLENYERVASTEGTELYRLRTRP